jgi:hypothetical protein
MSMNSIADGVATFKLQAFKAEMQLKKPEKDTGEAVVFSKGTEGPSKTSDAVKESAPASVADKNPVRGMSHIAESYDARGKVITKYMDSSNNVIYQTPSEMVVKTQELMTNNQAATNITG